MDLKDHLALMARYHDWAYRRLFEVIERVGEDDYRRDLGLFFTSIHGSLNHLLVADRLWYTRFTAAPVPALRLNQELETGRAALREALLDGARAWSAFIDELTPATLDGMLSYRNTKGIAVSVPFGPTLAHVFNHATHHRGQVSTALTQLGMPAPEMDLVYYLVERQKSAA